MVTKLSFIFESDQPGSVLAKILMVTKLDFLLPVDGVGSVLAKILMVTKPSDL